MEQGKSKGRKGVVIGMTLDADIDASTECYKRSTESPIDMIFLNQSFDISGYDGLMG
jgi:hypothetical protein